MSWPVTIVGWRFVTHDCEADFVSDGRAGGDLALVEPGIAATQTYLKKFPKMKCEIRET